MKNLILIFESTHKVIKAEKVLINKHIKHEIIPTPRDISSNCGMSIRIERGIIEPVKLKEILEKNNLEFKIFEK